ncbi:hypothetical protein SALBM311S_09372 [Streptomyces alboniger]
MAYRTLQVLPFDQGGHEAMGGSLTVLTLPDGSEVAYTEGADYGQLIEEPTNACRSTRKLPRRPRTARLDRMIWVGDLLQAAD